MVKKKYFNSCVPEANPAPQWVENQTVATPILMDVKYFFLTIETPPYFFVYIITQKSFNKMRKFK